MHHETQMISSDYLRHISGISQAVSQAYCQRH